MTGTGCGVGGGEGAGVGRSVGPFVIGMIGANVIRGGVMAGDDVVVGVVMSESGAGMGGRVWS